MGEKYDADEWSYVVGKVEEMQRRIKAAEEDGRRDSAADQGLRYWQKFVRNMSKSAI